MTMHTHNPNASRQCRDAYAAAGRFVGFLPAAMRSPRSPRWWPRLEHVAHALRSRPELIAWCAILTDAAFLLGVVAGVVP